MQFSTSTNSEAVRITWFEDVVWNAIIQPEKQESFCYDVLMLKF